ncbi:hypothetical protein [Halosegnis longus]|uniref:hypothetical protein n=1 Tax=Halosegnis longus TaxID=2216012 RepID=UPI00117CBDEF|nr:hypothetical protein [Salella cibi]
MGTNVLSRALSRLRRETNDADDSLVQSRAAHGDCAVAVYAPADASAEELAAIRDDITTELARMEADAEALAETDRGEGDDQ